jgi:hypothetical protein
MVAVPSLQIPVQVWIELHDSQNSKEADACGVIVRMEDGTYYTAVFVTLPYLARQMDLSYECAKGLPYTPPVRYAALETPHLIVPNLQRDTIEDTIDNLLALDIFESLFTQVSDVGSGEYERASVGRRATADVAAVVLNEVLVLEGGTVA